MDPYGNYIYSFRFLSSLKDSALKPELCTGLLFQGNVNLLIVDLKREAMPMIQPTTTLIFLNFWIIYFFHLSTSYLIINNC